MEDEYKKRDLLGKFCSEYDKVSDWADGKHARLKVGIDDFLFQMNKASEERQIPPEISWLIQEQLKMEQTEFDQLGSPEILSTFR